jgi:hypothetical protein
MCRAEDILWPGTCLLASSKHPRKISIVQCLLFGSLLQYDNSTLSYLLKSVRRTSESVRSSVWVMSEWMLNEKASDVVVRLSSLCGPLIARILCWISSLLMKARQEFMIWESWEDFSIVGSIDAMVEQLIL